jgi:hypothetical protein
LPQAIYSFRNRGEFFSRLNAEGTFQSGWLTEEMARTGLSAPILLLDRVAHAFLSLNYYPAVDFYGASIPLLEFVTAALFLLGLGYALARLRQPAHLLLVGHFWATTVAVGVFAIPPSADSYRMLIALPVAVLLAAIGWEKLAALVAGDGARRAVWLGMAALVITTSAAINLTAYFSVFAGKCRHGGDVQTRFASHLGSYLQNVPPDTVAYLLNTDELRYGTHPSVDFLSNDHPVINVPEPASGLAPAGPTVVMAPPERVEELRALAARYPGGEFSNVIDCEQLALTAYQLP